MWISIPVLSAVSWVIIEVMVLLNPSGTLPIKAVGPGGVVFFITSTAAAFLLPYLSMKTSKKKRFFLWFCLGFLLLLVFTWIAGHLFHRDFYTYSTQIILIYFVLVLLKLDTLGIVRRKKEVYRALSTAVIALFILWNAWLIMMAYAIVTRAEPRWIESTGYNLVNVVIGLCLVLSAGLLWNKTKRTVSVKGESLFFDERNISSILSPRENLIVRLFIKKSKNTLNCEELYSLLWLDESREENPQIDCKTCRKERWTTSSCSFYLNMKNRIADVKKYLELLRIGTIIPASENPREIKTLGWSLRFFDDVRHDSGRSNQGSLS